MGREINKLHLKHELSPFGRKVLHVMVDHWKLESERNKNARQVQQPLPVRNKKVLTFRNSDNEKALTHYETNIENDVKHISPCNTNSNQSFIQKIPKSSELIRTVEVNDENDLNTSVKNNFIHQRSFTACDEVDLNLNINSSEGRELTAPIFELNINVERDNLNTVAWDDMFDTELITPNIKQDKVEEVTKCSDEITNITVNDVIINKDCEEQGDNSMNKIRKEKKQKKNTDATSKKVKKCKGILQNNLRKQNYTKTVKNWLKDIQSNNMLDEKTPKDAEYGDKGGQIDAQTNKYKPKKVVQAQLANKNGVMKFSIPNYLIGNHTEQLREITQKATNKDKRKTKFIVPIKSQTPVKDIVYELCIINEDNIQNIVNVTSDIIDGEFIAVLMYSNGISQLNHYHTDDICVPDGIMLYFDNVFYYLKGGQELLLKSIIRLLENNEMICYDGKNILIYLLSMIEIDDIQFNIIDAKIGGSLLHPDNTPDNFKELQKLLDFVPQYTIATECPLQKCAWYTTLLKECVIKMKSILLESSLTNVFLNIEMRLLPVLAGMEYRGVKVDTQKLKTMDNLLLSIIKVVEDECYKTAGKTFQINSSMQVSAILYDELELDVKSNVTIKETVCKGAKSTSETMLRSLVSVHPLPKLILEYRHLHKAHSTFLAGIAQHVKDGVIKPTWEQNAAATGRIASNNPNLQAIPKAPFILDVFPQTDIVDPPLLNFRSVYIPREGYAFLAADFKHVECRVFAHAAADTGLLVLLANGEDLFKALAEKWLKKSEAEVTSEDRERTKRIVYASLYGAGPRKLMDILNMNYEETLAVISSFNRTFPSLKLFGRTVVSRCEQNDGRLTTVCGRVRRFKNITSSEFTLKSQAERQAVNFIVQGSAADLCKIAMVKTMEQLKNSNPRLEAHLVLQIHDELVWEVREQDLEKTAVLIKNVMENCGRECGMSLTLPVSVSSGYNWGDMSERTLHK